MSNHVQGRLRLYKPKKTVMNLKAGETALIAINYWSVYVRGNFATLCIFKNTPVYTTKTPECTEFGDLAVYASITRTAVNFDDYRDFELRLDQNKEIDLYNLYEDISKKDCARHQEEGDYLVFSDIPALVDDKPLTPQDFYGDSENYRVESDTNIEKVPVLQAYDLSTFNRDLLPKYSNEDIQAYLKESLAKEVYEISILLRNELKKRGILS